MNYMVVVIFILISPNIIMIRLSLRREKWVNPSSNYIFTMVPAKQSNNKLSNRRYTKVKQVRLEVFTLPVGNFYQTFSIIMRFLHLLKGRLNIPIITALLLWIATIWHIKVIDRLKATNMYLVGKLQTPLTQ